MSSFSEAQPADAATRRAVEIEHRVEAPPEVVFSYFTDPARHVRWQGSECELDPRPGGVYRVRFGADTWISGTYVEVEPPLRLVLAWGWETPDPLSAVVGLEAESATLDGLSERELAQVRREIGSVTPGSTTVEIHLVPDGAGTVIHLRHRGFVTSTAAFLHRHGWDVVLARLAALDTE